MTGYDGYSKSNNAIDAENKGRYPISHARVIVAHETGIAQKEAERVLRGLPNSGKEYHHTSKRFNITYYFDATAAVKVIRYAQQTGAPVDAVIEMLEENDIDILDMNMVAEAATEAAHEALVRAKNEKESRCSHDWTVHRLRCGLLETPRCECCGRNDWGGTESRGNARLI